MRRLFAVVAGFGGLVACQKDTPQVENAAAPVAAEVAAAPSFSADPELDGLKMKLYEATPADAGVDRPPHAAGAALTDQEAGSLLARLPPMDKDAAEAVDFALRQGPTPRPRTGETVHEAFPPDASAGAAPEVDPGPVTVLRRSPEGPVPMAPKLSLTFNQPMVALSSQEEASQTVPVSLSPSAPGTWRWLGTRTLEFKADGHMPMATRTTVTVPAGIKGTHGGALAQDETWSFETPPPTLQRMGPTSDGYYRGVYGNPQPTNPLIWLGFDQRVDPAAIADHVRLVGGGDAKLRLATPEEIAAKPAIKALVHDAEPGRMVVLTPASPLDLSTTYVVSLPKGTPSAEGPLTTKNEQSFSFVTYGPLRAVRLHCWEQNPCPPTSPWSLELTNPLDPATVDPALVSVDPAVPGLQVVPSGNTLMLYGAYAPRTTYTVTLKPGLKDVFGQTLQKGATYTLATGAADTSFRGPPQPFVQVEPGAPPELSFFTVNQPGLRVTVHRVVPEDWSKWTDWYRRYQWEDREPGAMPGTQVLSKVIPIQKDKDDLVETALDLKPYLKDGLGHLVVKVEPTRQAPERWARQTWVGWVQASALGLTAFTDRDALVGWVSAMADGKPTAGATLSLVGTQGTPAQTDASGLATLPLTDEPSVALIARKGEDAALLPVDIYGYSGDWRRRTVPDSPRWYTFTDRNLYKPKETVQVRGWIRTLPAGKDKDLIRWENPDTTFYWKALSSLGNPLGEGTFKLSKSQGFSLSLDLPATPDLGQARIEFAYTKDGSAYFVLPFEIQEFRTPEFEVTASGGDGVYALGEDATVDVRAAYYAGGALPAAPVSWTVTATPASYSPPGHTGWDFGPWAPWWCWWNPVSYSTNQESLYSLTDADGSHHLGVHFEALNPIRPMTVTAEATITDVNRQAWTASRSFLVHPSAAYVGLRSSRLVVEQGQDLDIETLRVDREGKELAGQVKLELQRLQWKQAGGTWKEVGETVATQTVGPAAAGKATFKPEAGGSYAVVATTRDEVGRENRTEIRVTVSGDAVEPDRSVGQEQVVLIPDKPTYAVGDTATILVQAPFFPAEGVLTLRAGLLLETRPFSVTGSTAVLKVPITRSHIPDLTLAVDLVGARTRTDDQGKPREDLVKRPAFGAGTVTVKVPPLIHTLDVQVTPAQARLEPGAGTNIDLLVRDPAGKPVADAELAVVAVDEAVLALTGYKLPDPLEVFYVSRGDGVATQHSRAWLQLARSTVVTTASLQGAAAGEGGLGVFGRGAAPMGGAVDELAKENEREESRAAPAQSVLAARTKSPDAPPPPPPPPPPGQAPTTPSEPKADGPAIDLRANFSALALWAPEVHTDAQGKARVALKLPDNLTRYRIMVVAVSGDTRFGSGEANVTARLPLMVRPSAPRFLNFGDRFELPVVLQNQTDAPLTVSVAVRAANASLLGAVTDPLPDPRAAGGRIAGQRVTVPANDRVEVRFPAAAAMAGTATFQLAAASGAYADAASVTLPVWTPATTEAFATYGTFDQGAMVQAVSPPKDVWSQFGGLEITLSSTQLQALTDAFLYLRTYPYDCSEQLSSRILAIAALQDVLQAFDAPGMPSADDIAASMSADLDLLRRRQNDDGGFPFWRRGDESWPYLTIHVAHALVLAEQKGYPVDPRMKARALDYLEHIQSHLPGWYSKESKWYLRGYALHVLATAGQDQAGKARALLGEAGVDALPAEAKGWILPILHRAGAKKEVASLLGWLQNHVTESAAGAHLVTGYDDGAYVLLHSDRGVDGIWIDALLQTDPKNDLLPKLVNGLLAHQTAGRWGSTTENAFVLLALDRYFRVYESVTPDFVARAWLGEGYAGDHTFRGRTTERAQIDVPMSWLQAQGAQDLTLSREGAGRLYYRIGMRYAPLDLRPKAAEYGFTVLRTYEGVDDPADVTQDKDGVWHMKAGARVRVRLTMVAPMRRYHVALVDPLPAGLEVLNPDLKGSGTPPMDPSANAGRPYWWWNRTWYDHENLRDERVEAFASLLYDGVHSYTYVARATTPGDFVVPPAKAEEMYSPETFGRTGGDRVRVE